MTKEKRFVKEETIKFVSPVVRAGCQFFEAEPDRKKRELEEKYNPTIPRKNDGLCVRCRKNKATITYTNSILDWTHGFVEHICQECYDKQKKENSWYKAGRNEFIQEEIIFLKSMLQTKAGKELSKARTQDTGRKTIPDIYDRKIKERVRFLEKVNKENPMTALETVFKDLQEHPEKYPNLKDFIKKARERLC